MTSSNRKSYKRWLVATGAFLVLVLALPFPARAGFHWLDWWNKVAGTCCTGSSDVGGEWYWMRSPEQEKRVIVSHYNRYCVRCHGVDGRGVWDIPDVPDFTNARWQMTRSDGQLVRATLEGRGACMPPFRGTLTLEETWAMARYLRTFVPGTELPRPDRVPTDPPREPTKAPEQLLPPPGK